MAVITYHSPLDVPLNAGGGGGGGAGAMGVMDCQYVTPYNAVVSGVVQGVLVQHQILPINVTDDCNTGAFVGGQVGPPVNLTVSSADGVVTVAEVVFPDIGFLSHLDLAGSLAVAFRDGAAVPESGPHHGTLVGGVVQAASLFKAADNSRGSYDFNGTTGYGSVPHAAAQNITSISIGCWVNWDTFTGFRKIIVKPAGSGWTAPALGIWGLSYYQATNKIEFFTTDGGTHYSFLSLTSPSTGTLYHIVVTYDRPTSTFKIYINGVLDNTIVTTVNILQTSTQPVAIGSRSTTSIDAAELMDGKIEELAVWNRALTAAEVTTWYNEQNPGGGGAKRRLSKSWFAALRTGLIAIWHMSDTRDVIDVSEQARVVTAAGGATLTAPAAKFGALGWDFDGVDGVAWMENDYALRLHYGGGYEFWIDPDTLAAEQVLVEHAQDDDNRWTVDITATGRLRFTYRFGATTFLQIDDGGGILVTGAHQHVLWGYDAETQTVRLFIGGVLVASGTLNRADIGFIDGPVAWGSNRLRGGTNHYDGQMDEPRMAQHHPIKVAAFTPEAAAYLNP